MAHGVAHGVSAEKGGLTHSESSFTAMRPSKKRELVAAEGAASPATSAPLLTYGYM